MKNALSQNGNTDVLLHTVGNIVLDAPLDPQHEDYEYWVSWLSDILPSKQEGKVDNVPLIKELKITDSNYRLMMNNKYIEENRRSLQRPESVVIRGQDVWKHILAKTPVQVWLIVL